MAAKWLPNRCISKDSFQVKISRNLVPTTCKLQLGPRVLTFLKFYLNVDGHRSLKGSGCDATASTVLE